MHAPKALGQSVPTEHQQSELGQARAFHEVGARTDFRTPFVIVTVLATLLVLCLLAGRSLRRWRLRRRMSRARQGEVTAAVLLRDAGFRVLGTQVGASYQLRENHRAVTIAVRVDYVVEREGRRFVAEVKTGEQVTSILHPATRRQLFEYQAVFPGYGLLLVDAQRRTIRAIELPQGGAESGSRVLPQGGWTPWVWFVAGALVGGALACGAR